MSRVDPLPALLFFDDQMARGPSTVTVVAVRPLCLHLSSFLLLLPVARRREVFGFPTGPKKRRLIPVCEEAVFAGKFGRGWEVDFAYLVSGEGAEEKPQVYHLVHRNLRLLEPALVGASG